jgi:predicted ATPase/class 3 adenylate cyclase
VTFVFTDIEGSTERWDRDRVAMQAAVRRHDELMRANAQHGGRIFKTIGDAFCLAFARAEDAVASILAAQRALAKEDFSAVGGILVRAAMHTGTADERDGDYFGPAVNRVARLLGIGHGGQILVSGVTAELVRGNLPPQADLRDLGEHRLRDLARREHVHQLVAADLVADFPPLRSLDGRPNNLPHVLTSFVGREREIAEIATLLQAHQLVTLVGSGGVGKTRTSLHVAASMLDGLRDGVWFCELAPLSRGEYIATTVAQALGLSLPGTGDPLESLVGELKRKSTLIVFDNCEHLVEATAHAASAILRGCPNVKILASSRQVLGITGEETYRLPSLDVPSDDDLARLSANDALQSAAVALFVERARTVDKRFALADENAPIVADICRRLDGIPLALELAAARVNILSPRQLRDRLDERFRVLTGGSRDVLPRQQTLRALIDWSHDLLDERERALFRRLGIFMNGFTHEGATAGGSGDDVTDLDVFDVLASLVNKSLVLAEPDGDSVRYRLLESTRVYALEKLEAAGEREALASRHLRYLRDHFAALWERCERSGRPAELNEALQTELDDVRSALDGALSRAELIEGGELVAATGTAWNYLGLEPEGIARCERYMAAIPSHESGLLAKIATGLSELLFDSGRRVRAMEISSRAITFGRESGDRATLARALTAHANSAVLLGRLDDVRSALAEAEAIPEAREFASTRFSLLKSRAQWSRTLGDFETAARAFEQQRKEARSAGNVDDEVCATVNLAELEHERGHAQRAIEVVSETLPLARSGTAKNKVAAMLHNLAGYLAAVDDLGGAAAAAREAIRIVASREPDPVYVAIPLEHLALVFALRGELARAAILEGCVQAVFERDGYNREPTECMTHERLIALIREGLSPAELAESSAEGAALTLHAAILLAREEP